MYIVKRNIICTTKFNYAGQMNVEACDYSLILIN